MLGSRDDYGGFTFRWSLPDGKTRSGRLGLDRAGGRPQGRALGARAAGECGPDRLDRAGQGARRPDGRTTRGGDPVLVRTFQVGDQVATLRVKGSIAGRSLTLEVDIDKPVAAWIDAGGWGPVARRRAIPTPYYNGKIDFFPVEDLFVAGQDRLDDLGGLGPRRDRARGTNR